MPLVLQTFSHKPKYIKNVGMMTVPDTKMNRLQVVTTHPQGVMNFITGNRIAVETSHSEPQTNQPPGEYRDPQKHKYSSSGDPKCLYKRSNQHIQCNLIFLTQSMDIMSYRWC